MTVTSTGPKLNPYQAALIEFRRQNTAELLQVTFGAPAEAQANVASVLAQAAALQNAAHVKAEKAALAAAAQVPTLTSIRNASNLSALHAIDRVITHPGSHFFDATA